METQNKNSEPYIPDNLDELIPESLRAVIPDRPDRGLFYIDGHPDLFLRTTYYPDTFEGAEHSWEQLKGSGVNVVPYRVSEYRGYPIVFTSRVTGTKMLSALEESPIDSLIDEVDATWGSLLRYLVRCKEDGSPVAADLLEDPDQCMYGTLPGQTEPHVVMVDLTDEALDISDIDDYAIEVLAGANVIGYLERLAGRSLPKARDALAQAIAILERASDGNHTTNSSTDALDDAAKDQLRAVSNAARYAVAHQAIVEYDDPRLRELPLIADLH